MRRFIKLSLIGGSTICLLKKRKQYIDCFVTNSALEIFYLSLYFLNLISYRQNGGRRYRSGTWAKLIKRDGRKCAVCGFTDGLLTIDHVVPISKGGHPRWLGNLQILCKICNFKKGNK